MLCPHCKNQIFPQEDFMNATPFRCSTGHKDTCGPAGSFFFLLDGNSLYLIRLITSDEYTEGKEIEVVDVKRH